MEQSAVKMVDRVTSPTLSTSKNDSLDDFKSPKTEPAVSVIKKVKILNDKRVKKTTSKGKTTTSTNRKKDGTTSGRQMSNGNIAAQPTIESSFFKAANSANKGGHTCPLCMKYFADINLGTAHSKNCATKHNVSTRKLLAAVALQERQADERLAIGLPPGPFVQPKEKAPRRIRDRVSKADSDLQLALALSKSLQETELEQEFEEALLLATEHRADEPIIEMSDSQRRKTLKNFGFVTNKSVASGVSEGPIKSRRRKHLGPTILQTRTQDARNRLLTEKIAEILMGNEAITQICPQSNSDESERVAKHKTVLCSRLLNDIHQTTKRIWDTAQLSSGITNFYVKDLGPVVLPNGDGQQKTSANHVGDPKGRNTIERDEVKESFESNEAPPETNERVSTKISNSASNLIQENKFQENSLESKNIHITDRQYRNTLPNDWSNTLNVSSMSDVVVLVKNNHIWAHKLVFHVRCSDILLDCEPNNDARFSHVREKICWHEIDFLTALAFLEFVYSGIIVQNCHIFEDNRLVAGIRRLARKYRLKDLFDYLRKNKAEIDTRREIEMRNEGLRSPIVIEVNQTQREKENLQENLIQENEIQKNYTTTAASTHDPSSLFSSSREIVELFVRNVSLENIVDDGAAVDTIDVKSTANNHRASTMSPDLFDETIQESDAMEEDPKNTEESTKEISQVQTQDNSNLKVLAQLIADDDSSYDKFSQRSSISNDDVPEKFYSPEPIHNYTSLSEGRVETPKSRGVANDTRRMKDRSRSQRLSEKQKSNLSLFIEKVQKINAKPALDSYTEEESLAGPIDRRRFRNPFNINNVSNRSIPGCIGEEKSRNPDNHEQGLNVRVEDSQSGNGKENYDDSSADESINVNETSRMRTKNLEESSLNDETINTDDKDTSMYSKYKKSHKHENSISNYRDMLEKLTQSTRALTKNNEDNNESFLHDNAIDLTQEESDAEVDMPKSSSSSVRPPNIRKPINRIMDTDSNDSVATMINSQEKSAFINDNNDFNISDDAKNQDSRSSISLSPVIKRTAGRGKANSISSSIEDLDKDLEELGNNSRKSLEFPDLDIFEVDEEIFTEKHSSISLDEESSCPSVVSGKAGSSRRKEKSDGRMKKNRSINESKYDEGESNSDESSQEAKSLRNSSEYPVSDVFEVNEEILTQSMQNPDQSLRRTLTPSLGPDSPRKFITSRWKGSPNVTRLEEWTQDGESGQKPTDTFSKGTKSPRNWSKHPDFDVIEVNEEIFTQSLKNPKQPSCRTSTPSPQLDSPRKLKSSRRKRSSKATSLEILTQDEEKGIKCTNKFFDRTKSPMNSPEYPPFDYFEPDDEIFTQSLKNDSPHRTLTPLPSRRKGSSNEGKTRDLNLIENLTDQTSREAMSPRACPKYPDLDFLQRNDDIFTQTLKIPDYLSRRSLTPVSNRKRLQLPSPIIISSSPELDADLERSMTSIERNSNKENAFASALNVSPLNSRQSVCEFLDRLSPLNFQSSPEPDTSQRQFSSHRDSSNSVKKFLSRSYSMPASTSNSETHRKKTGTPKKSSRLSASQEITPPMNYDTMDTPELKRELEKYGIKPQKRKRARQLLNHIYNELHPALPATSSTMNSTDNLIKACDNEEPPSKKIGRISDRTANDSESDRENSLSQESVASQTSIIPEEMDFSDGDTAPINIADSTSVKEAVNALVKADKVLHNKLLTYEPLQLEPLHTTLKAQGFKCKLNDLMDYLDGECITYQVLAQLNQKRTRKPKSRTIERSKNKSTEKLSSAWGRKN